MPVDSIFQAGVTGTIDAREPIERQRRRIGEHQTVPG
jgi:hypothetical protein